MIKKPGTKKWYKYKLLQLIKFRIIKKEQPTYKNVEDEILSKMNKKAGTKKWYKYKSLQLIREYKPKNKNNLDF